MVGDSARRSIAVLIFTSLTVPAMYGSAEFTPCKNGFTPQQQIELGDKAKAQVYKTTPVLPDSSPVARYIQQLGARLTANAPGYKWPYNFHVANVADINAFALPGGSVFVNLGTIQAAADEAQLAGVMAHEISHVVLQHAVCNAEKQQRVGLFAGLGQIAAGVLLGGAAGQLAQEGIGLTAGLGFLKMSRGAEREADLEGVGIAYDTGFDPHGLPQFFQTIQSRYGSGGAQFLSDHPNPGNRTEYVGQEIASYPPKQYLPSSAAFARVKTEVAGMRAYTAKEVASGVWKTRDASQTVGGGMSRAPAAGAAAVVPDLNTGGAWKRLRGNGFALDIPGNWQVYGGQDAHMAGPPGGITRSGDGAAGGVLYGMLTDRYRPRNGSGVEPLDALLGEIARDNPGFSAGDESEIIAAGAAARSVECDNPGANGGRGEHDWVVAFQRPDGTLRYFVFVAPARDFERLRPAFRRILASLRFE